jgi:hypothetical protein
MASVLTEGLTNIQAKNETIIKLVKELKALHNQLQDGHFKAKQDPDHGEVVLELYVSFMAKRNILIAELQRQNVSVPWQLHVKIDEFELSVSKLVLIITYDPRIVERTKG